MNTTLDGGTDVGVTEPRAAMALGYATPQEPPAKDRVAPSLALVALFICGATVGLFAIVCDSERNTMRGIDLWPVAAATIALVGMGVGFAFFMTRRR